MPNDLQSMFSSLRDDTDVTWLAGPEQLREVGDRQARVRTVSGLTAVAVIVLAGLVGVAMLTRGDGSSGLPPTAPSSTAPTVITSEPTTTPDPSVSDSEANAIPDSAFLDLKDVNGNGPETAPYDLPATEQVLPRLCGASFASQAKITDRRARHAIYYLEVSPDQFPEGSFDESITAYQTGGAEQFMAEVRAALAACPNDAALTVPLRYTTVDEDIVADDSITIIETGTYPMQPGAGTYEASSPVRVIRAGDAVLILRFTSWEGMGFDQAVADAMRDRAIARFTGWAR